jgi:cytochrome c556
MPRPALLLAVVVLLSACGGEPEDTRPGQPVAHRRAAFKEMIKTFEEMGAMLRKDKFNSAKYASLTTTLIAVRDKPWQYFGPDTLYPPSRATDAVWSQPEKFEAGKKAFFAATDKLAATTGTQDARVAKAAFAEVEKTCRDCHESFKKR